VQKKQQLKSRSPGSSPANGLFRIRKVRRWLAIRIKLPLQLYPDDKPPYEISNTCTDPSKDGTGGAWLGQGCQSRP